MSYTMKSNCCGCPQDGSLGYAPQGRIYYPPQPIRAYHNGIFGSTAGSSIRQTFDCEAVWADAQEGGKIGEYLAWKSGNCPPKVDPSHPTYAGIQTMCQVNEGKISSANYRGGKAADQIRRALNELGYGPLNLGVAWGGADKAAWEAFTSSHGLPAGPGLVNKAGLCQLEADLRGGSKGVAKAGLSKGLLIALAAAAVVGVGAMAMGKKKKGAAAAGAPPAGFGAA